MRVVALIAAAVLVGRGFRRWESWRDIAQVSLAFAVGGFAVGWLDGGWVKALQTASFATAFGTFLYWIGSAPTKRASPHNRSLQPAVSEPAVPMKPPIVVCAEGELQVFEDAERVLAYVEHYDVADGVYEEVYDSEGRRLELALHGRLSLLSQPRVELVGEAEPTHVQDLRALLQKHLKTDEDSLRELVRRAEERFPAG